MVKIGYKLMTEEHGPKAIVENAIRAEAAGFDFLSISDHFHPWLESQGHASFAWSMLGAIAHATSTIGIATGLTCPIIRYHPAVIAQAAATIAIMSDGRFTFAVGAGEALNEHVTGQRWPAVPERHAMLAEAIDIFRLLWKGGVHSFLGEHYVVNHARLYDVPDTPIPLVIGVSGPASIALAVAKADGIMTTEPSAELVDGYRKGASGGAGFYSEAVIAYAESEQAGLALARERFRFAGLGWAVNSEMPHVAGFEAASQFIRPEDLADLVSAGPDVAKHVALVKRYADAGYDHIVLTCPGDEQAAFIAYFESELKPALASL